jgi:hypothetical protein
MTQQGLPVKARTGYASPDIRVKRKPPRRVEEP